MQATPTQSKEFGAKLENNRSFNNGENKTPVRQIVL